MFFTLLAGKSGHVVFQHIKSLILLLLMVALFIATPHFIIYWHQYMYAGAAASGRFHSFLLEYWPYIYFTAAVVAFLLNEYSAHKAMRNEVDHTKHPRMVALLEELSRRAGFKKRPALLVTKHKMPNAFAHRSITFGRKVGLVGRVQEVGDKEIEAIMAHEVGHLRNRDMMVGMPIYMMEKAMNWHALIPWLFFLGFVAISAAAGWLAGVIAQKLTTGYEAILRFAVGTVAVLAVIYGLYEWFFDHLTNLYFVLGCLAIFSLAGTVFGLLRAAHSRCREYMADAAAVRFIGWENRHHLIVALVRLRAIYAELAAETRREMEDRMENKGKKLRPLKKNPPTPGFLQKLLYTHPTLERRARALDVELASLHIDEAL